VKERRFGLRELAKPAAPVAIAPTDRERALKPPENESEKSIEQPAGGETAVRQYRDSAPESVSASGLSGIPETG